MAIIQIKKISVDETNLGQSNYFNRYWKNLDFGYLQNRIANSYDLNAADVLKEEKTETNKTIEENNSDSDIALGRIRTWYRGRELAGFTDNIESYNEFNQIYYKTKSDNS